MMIETFKGYGIFRSIGKISLCEYTKTLKEAKWNAELYATCFENEDIFIYPISILRGGKFTKGYWGSLKVKKS